MKHLLQVALTCSVVGGAIGYLFATSFPVSPPKPGNGTANNSNNTHQGFSQTEALTSTLDHSLFSEKLLTLQRIASIDTSELETTFALLSEQSGDGKPSEELKALVRRWVELSPEGALTAIKALENPNLRNSLLTEAFTTWVKISPQEAFQYSATSLPTADALSLRESMFLAWSENDPSAAMTHWHSLHEPGASFDILKRMALNWAHTDLASATEHFKSTKSAFERDILQYYLIGEMGKRDDTKTLSWINEHFHGSDRSIAMSTFCTALARVEPEKAVKIVGTLPPGETKNSVTETLARTWAKTDLKGSLAWVEGLGENPGTPELRRSVYITHAFCNHEEAKANLQNIEDPNLRSGIAGIIGDRMAQTGPQAALEWASGLAPDLKMEAFSSAATAWAKQNGNDAIVYALNEIEDPELQTTMLSRIAPFFGAQDPATASTYLDHLPDGPVKEHTAREIMANWIDQDPNAATAWAESIRNDSVYHEIAQAAAGVHLQTDPDHALTWAQTVPDPTERYNLIDGLVSELSRMDAHHALDTLMKSELNDSLKLEMINKVLVTTGYEPVDSL